MATEKVPPLTRAVRDMYEHTVGPGATDGLAVMEEGKEILEIDIANGYPELCTWCGFVWSVHRFSDSVCPGTRTDGTLWRMQYAPNLSPGTKYKAPDGK